MSDATKSAPVRRYEVIVAGGGFGGAYCAKYLGIQFGAQASNRAALIASQNVLAFQPMLAEVVGGSLSPLDVVTPLHTFCRGTNVMQGKIVDIDLSGKFLTLDAGRFTPNSTVYFDHLVLALGCVVDVSRVPGMMEHGYILKEAWDAVRLRLSIIERLEEANLSSDAAIKRRLLTFVVVGGGYSGVETAGQILDYVGEVRHVYLNLKDIKARVILIHSRDHILPEIGEKLGVYAEGKLRARGMEIRLNERVTSVTARKVVLSGGDMIETHTVVSTVGNATHPLLVAFCEKCGIENLKGRICTDETMRVKGTDNLWAIGDCAAVPLDGQPACPPTAQFALRQGIQVSKNIVRALSGTPLKPFKFKEQGQLASIGHHTAVAHIFGFQFSGMLAWFIWRTIYASKIPGLQRKLRVVIGWTFDLLFSREISVIRPETPVYIQDMHFEKDDLVLQESDPYLSFYIIKSGAVDCFKDGTLIKTLRGGDHLGGRDFAAEGKWFVRAVVTEPATLISIRREVWNTLLLSKQFAERFPTPAGIPPKLS
jgi:NADH:ubiquinone reductase (H+-translocating)